MTCCLAGFAAGLHAAVLSDGDIIHEVDTDCCTSTTRTPPSTKRRDVTLPGGEEVVIYNMHMDASNNRDEMKHNDGKDKAARLAQWQQLRDYIMAHLDGRPVIVAGDMNSLYHRDPVKTQFIDAINASQTMLQAVVEGDEQAVAHGVDLAHDEHTSILSYNNENSLSCVLTMAFYYARREYTFHRELPTGKGFADLVLMPRKQGGHPAILLELKKDSSAGAAIEQIHSKSYKGKVAQYDGQVILVGINYDSKSKKHDCKIEFLSDNQ